MIRGRKHNFGFNGIELNEDLGVDLYEMPLRSYDPTIGRWTSQDPVIHHQYSPYAAFDNNPVYYADPSGADAVVNDYGTPTGNPYYDYGGPGSYQEYISGGSNAGSYSQLWGRSGSFAGAFGSTWTGANLYGIPVTNAVAQFAYDNPESVSLRRKYKVITGDLNPWADYFEKGAARMGAVLNRIDPAGQAKRGLSGGFWSPFKALGAILGSPSLLLETPDVKQSLLNSITSLPGGRLGLAGFKFLTSAMQGDMYGMGHAYGSEAGQLSLEAGSYLLGSGLSRGISRLNYTGNLNVGKFTFSLFSKANAGGMIGYRVIGFSRKSFTIFGKKYNRFQAALDFHNWPLRPKGATPINQKFWHFHYGGSSAGKHHRQLFSGNPITNPSQLRRGTLGWF